MTTDAMLQRDGDGADQVNGLKPHHWLSLKSQSDIEDFRLKHNLIRVDAKPQDAALTPSWPEFLARLALYCCLLVVLLVFAWNGSTKSPRKYSTKAAIEDLENKGPKDTKPSSSPIVGPNQEKRGLENIDSSLDPIAKQDPKEGILTSSEPAMNPVAIGNTPKHDEIPLETTENDVAKSHDRYPGLDLNAIIVLPVALLFPFWMTAFVMSEMEGKSGGWVSVLYWVDWIPLTTVSPFFLIPLVFHWSASLAMLIQRWTGSIGSMAYEITDLHGCIPYEGLGYLQEGRYSRGFRIFQTVGFASLTMWWIHIARRILKGKTFSILTNNPVGIILLALIVYIGVIADRGMPIVVSGNCLLVEESAQVGFVKADIRTAWKVLSFFLPVF